MAVELRDVLELLDWGRQIVGATTQMPVVPWLDTFWTAVGALTLGMILALWGGRILRTLIILTFMVAGAIAGKHLAGRIQIDLLIGLVIGAGIAGLIGYAFYRWWLGLLIGTLVAIVVAITFSAPKILDERQAFDDFRLGMGTGRYDTVPKETYTADQLKDYFWIQRRDFVYKTLGPVLLIGIIAFVATMLMPRLAAVVGTSTLGVLLVAGGAGLLLAYKWKDWWNSIQGHQNWVVVGLIVFWLFSIMYQFTHPTRPVNQAAMPPTASAV